MRSLFTFTGRIGRLPYVAASLTVFVSQQLALAGVYAARYLPPHKSFYIAPLHTVIALEDVAPFVSLAALVYVILAGWALSALAFRRATDAGVSGWIAAAVLAPAFVQIPVILFLSVMPSRAAGDPPLEAAAAAAFGPTAATQGVLAGMGLTIFAVALGALAFGTYGYGLFVLSPFLIGITTAYLANRQSDIGGTKTAQLVAAAAVLGGTALIVVALEGILCIIMAAPLGIGVALVGGLLGAAIARRRRGSPAQALSAVALLPLVFASEHLLALTTSFETRQTIEVAAPPGLVWQAIVHMDPIDARPALPFRLGIAYPIRGEVVGEGVGALRYGEFSTGTAIERVTEWAPERRLSFVVVDDVPAMRELSPYQHVHAPHVVGYFLTTNISFELLPLPGGRTKIVERGAHELRLDPVLYWLPMARWVVQENNRRVLAHIKHQAEQGLRRTGEPAL